MSEAGVRISEERLRALVDYDPDTGEFKWRSPPKGRILGQVAGSRRHGYRLLRLDGHLYRCSHLAWFLCKGEWPTLQIDHINRDRADDRIANLRHVTSSQNNMNKGPRPGTASGLKGVSWDNRDKLWVAEITVNGAQKKIGRFKDKYEAHNAYWAVAQKEHGEFGRQS